MKAHIAPHFIQDATAFASPFILLRIYVLAGMAFGIFDIGGIVVSITLATGELAISLGLAFCGLALSFRDTFNNFF